LLEQLRNLVSLQDVDAKIHRLKKEREDLPGRMAEMDKEVAQAEQEFGEQRERLSEIQKDHKLKERALEQEEENLKKWQKRLLDIKNTREYVALQREIEGQKKANSQREEEILLMLEEIEVLGKNVALLEENFRNLQGQAAKENAAVEANLKSIDGQVKALEKNRDQRMAAVDPDLLQKYDRIRSNRAGVGVSVVRDGHCLACMMGLPPQLYNELMRYDAIHACPSCGRILVWEGTGDDKITPDEG